MRNLNDFEDWNTDRSFEALAIALVGVLSFGLGVAIGFAIWKV